MVRDTPPSQEVSTNQIWNSYLKEYRRYGPDTKAGRTDGQMDGGTDSAITICLPKFLWGHKNLSKVLNICENFMENRAANAPFSILFSNT